MASTTPERLSFPPVAGHTVRADFEGGTLSSDFGPLLLRGVDRQIWGDLGASGVSAAGTHRSLERQTWLIG